MNDQTRREDAVTPTGAVEVSEQDLDRAAGGAMDIHQPVDGFSYDGSDASLDKAGQKSVPQDPSIGLLSDPQKKL